MVDLEKLAKLITEDVSENLGLTSEAIEDDWYYGDKGIDPNPEKELVTARWTDPKPTKIREYPMVTGDARQAERLAQMTATQQDTLIDVVMEFLKITNPDMARKYVEDNYGDLNKMNAYALKKLTKRFEDMLA